MTTGAGEVEPDRYGWWKAVRTSLTVQLNDQAPASSLVTVHEVEVGDWVSPQEAEARAAAIVVEPRIEALGALAERIGSRRGRLCALVWSLPVTIILLALAVILLLPR